MNPWDRSSTPSGIWIVPAMLAACALSVFITDVLMPWLEAKRPPKVRPKRRLPR